MQVEWQTTDIPSDGVPVFVLLAKPWNGSRVHTSVRWPNVWLVGNNFSYNVPKGNSIIGWCHQMEVPNHLERFYLVRYADGRWADLFCSAECAAKYHKDDVENESVKWLLSFARQDRRCFACDGMILPTYQYDRLMKESLIEAEKKLAVDYWRD